MSGALKLGNLKLPRLGAAGILSGAGNAGPRRLAILTVSVLVIGGLVVAIATGGRRAPPVSQDTRMGTVDPLPGGLHSTPEQDALARTAEEAHAKAALGQGVSYTPQMAPSVPVKGPIPHAEGPAPEQADPQRPRFVVRPTSTRVQSPVVLPVAFPTAGGNGATCRAARSGDGRRPQGGSRLLQGDRRPVQPVGRPDAPDRHRAPRVRIRITTARARQIRADRPARHTPRR